MEKKNNKKTKKEAKKTTTKVVTLLPKKKLTQKEKVMGVAKIKVVGVGGGGGNAVSRMYDYFPRGVDLIAINTDAQDLEFCQARKKIHIGKQTTKGLGAGMNPEMGRLAAEESREEIATALSGADLVFLTAGFGGGTGSGATSVVAEICQELGILTCAIVTKPFSFEGTQRKHIAEEALVKLKDRVDTFITISNDRIFSIIDKETSLNKAFEAIDEVLKNAVLGISELIMSPGIINVDFADIKTIIQGSGSSIIGVGIAGGKERATLAANLALSSPLLETSIDGAKGVLFSVSGLKDIKMNEINEVAKLVSEHVDPGAKIIFGTYYDRKLNKGSLKVTLIATGFGSSFGRNSQLFGDYEGHSQRSSSMFEVEDDFKESNKQSVFREVEDLQDCVVKDSKKSEIIDVEVEELVDDSVWDIPSFLRKKGKKK